MQIAMRPALLVLAGALAIGPACATNPVTGKRELALMSEAQELQLGLQGDAEVRQEMGLYDDPALQKYVQEIGARLATTSERPGLPWKFGVVDVAAVNAFALPGGYIYVTRGILPYLENESELAGVIGHEIGHVTARHSVQQYTRATLGQVTLAGVGLLSREARAFGNAASTGFGLLLLKYGRDDEIQADALGVRYASRAGWDPRGVPALLTTLGRLDPGRDKRGVPNWLETHPQPAARVSDVEPVVRRVEAGTQGGRRAVNREDYLRRIDGVLFGDNPREGIVRGAEFLHADLRFAVAFPSGWEVSNGKAQVVAARSDGRAAVLLQLVPNRERAGLRELAVAGMQRSGFALAEGERARVNGLDAFVGTYQGAMQGVGEVYLRAAHIALREQVYLVAGLVPAAAGTGAFRTFDATIRSFRELSRAEADAIRPNRVALYVVRTGDTWEAIARRGSGNVAPRTLAVMNGRDVHEPPRPGQRIKIVVEG